MITLAAAKSLIRAKAATTLAMEPSTTAQTSQERTESCTCIRSPAKTGTFFPSWETTECRLCCSFVRRPSQLKPSALHLVLYRLLTRWFKQVESPIRVTEALPRAWTTAHPGRDERARRLIPFLKLSDFRFRAPSIWSRRCPPIV